MSGKVFCVDHDLVADAVGVFAPLLRLGKRFQRREHVVKDIRDPRALVFVPEPAPPLNVRVLPLAMYRTAVELAFTAYALNPSPAFTVMSLSTMYTVPFSSVCLPEESVTTFLKPASASGANIKRPIARTHAHALTPLVLSPLVTAFSRLVNYSWFTRDVLYQISSRLC